MLPFHIFIKHLKSPYPEYPCPTIRADTLHCRPFIFERNLPWVLYLYLFSTFHAISCYHSILLTLLLQIRWLSSIKTIRYLLLLNFYRIVPISLYSIHMPYRIYLALSLTSSGKCLVVSKCVKPTRQGSPIL